jgi:hypothetical protein
MCFLQTYNVAIFDKVPESRGDRKRTRESTRVCRVKGERVNIIREKAGDRKGRGGKGEGTIRGRGRRGGGRGGGRKGKGGGRKGRRKRGRRKGRRRPN